MEFVNFLEHLLNITLVRRVILFSKKNLVREIKLTIFSFIQRYCCKESGTEMHARTGAKIHVVLRNWNRSDDGNVFQFHSIYSRTLL